MQVQYRGIGHAVQHEFKELLKCCANHVSPRTRRGHLRAAFTFLRHPTDTCFMHSVSPLYAAAELKAHEQRSNHAFAEAADSAEKAAEIALTAGDSISWWNMTFLQAENLLDAGLFAECATLARSLLTDTLGHTNG